MSYPNTSLLVFLLQFPIFFVKTHTRGNLQPNKTHDKTLKPKPTLTFSLYNTLHELGKKLQYTTHG